MPEAYRTGRGAFVALPWPRGCGRDRLARTHRVRAHPGACGPTAIASCASCAARRKAPTTCGGIPMAGTIDAAGLEGLDAVVHLAGAGIGDKKWTADAQAAHPREPHAGDGPARPHAGRARSTHRRCWSRGRRWGTTATGATRSSPRQRPPGDDFPAAGRASRGRRRPRRRPRPGSGWSPSAPASCSPPTAARSSACCSPSSSGSVAGIGSGEQYMSWITLDDDVGAIRPPARPRPSVSGPVNLTAPEPGDQRRVHRARSARCCTVRRCCPTPLFAAEGGVRRRARRQRLLVDGQRVLPRVLEASGYAFARTDVESALRVRALVAAAALRRDASAAAGAERGGVTEGFRTPDLRDHNPAL